jgi:hypothetical protein
VDPKAQWTLEGRRNYVLGAKKIADNCKGLNSILDDAFNREYTRAEEILGIDVSTIETSERLDKDLLI